MNNVKKIKPSPEAQSMATAIEGIRRMFVDVVQKNRIVDEKQTPARRAAFVKQHGSAHGVFQVNDFLPENYRIGIFQPGARFEAWVRYSSDVPNEKPDKNTTVGIGIKLFNVPGLKSLEDDQHSSTLDFILQNTEVFFAADAMEMCEFKTAALNGTLNDWLKENPGVDEVLTAMGSNTVKSVLTETMWSCVPYKFGDDNYCKFKISTEFVYEPENPVDIERHDYLAEDMQERLIKSEVRLKFYVQLRTDPDTQSITSARSLWKEDVAIPFHVATLTLPRQDISARNQGVYGETLSYNIWRTLAEMEPLGSIAEARKTIYRSSAHTRLNMNGQTIGEPTLPRPPGAPVPPYDSSFEQPWPEARSEEHEETEYKYFEKFDSANLVPLEPYNYREFPFFTLSTRDSSQGVTFEGFIQFPEFYGQSLLLKNEEHKEEKLRFIFEGINEGVKEVIFNVRVLSGDLSAKISVSCFNANESDLLAEKKDVLAGSEGFNILLKNSDVKDCKVVFSIPADVSLLVVNSVAIITEGE